MIDLPTISFTRPNLMIFIPNWQTVTKRNCSYAAKQFVSLGQKGHVWSRESNGGQV